MIGSDPGVCAAFNGGTHMPFEDVALYRAIPTATVIDVTDGNLLKNVLPKLPYLSGIKYLRVGRKPTPIVYADGEDFEIGRGVCFGRAQMSPSSPAASWWPRLWRPRNPWRNRAFRRR